MALVINTNIASVQSERALAMNRGNMEKAMQRLSSGKRINSAVDDAAGMAVAQRMRNQIQGLNMAIRNAGDGISMAQTAEGSVDELQNILARMRELAIQSSNDTYSDKDRSFLNAEFKELVKEIRRTSNQAAWDGDVPVLSEDAKPMHVQVGLNQADYIEIPLQPLTIEGMGLAGQTTYAQTSGAPVTTISFASVSSAITPAGVTTSNASNFLSGTISAGTSFGTTPAPNFTLMMPDRDLAASVALTAIGVQNLADLVTKLKQSPNYAPTIADIKVNSSGNGIEIVWKVMGGISPTGTPSLQTTNFDTASRYDYQFNASTQAVTSPNASAGYLQQTFDTSDITWYSGAVPEGPGQFYEVKIGGRTLTAYDATSLDDMIQKLKQDSDYNFVREEAGITGSDELFEQKGNKLVINFAAAEAGKIRYAATFRSSENSVNISTTERSIDALKYIDEAQVSVNTLRAKMGATMTRIQYTINNLMNLVENTESAKSRVLDTDYAAESANLAKSQILAQAGTAMLAQANQSQQYVLNLLKG